MHMVQKGKSTNASIPATQKSSLFTILIALDNLTKEIVVYPGIPVEELNRTLKVAFDAPDEICGLKDSSQGVHFPLSLLSQAPAYFSTRGNSTAYQLIFRGISNPDPLPRSISIDLTNVKLRKLVEVFIDAAPTGALDRTTFQKCFSHLVDSNIFVDSNSVKALNRLFDIFDHDRNGIVDVTEFLSGLSVLANGDRDEKIQSAFDLYDEDGDGYISLIEMTRYLTCVFSVIAETSPEIFRQHAVKPAELGEITAKQCFLEADTNKDGRLTFEEFKEWYAKPGNSTDMMHHDCLNEQFKKMSSMQWNDSANRMSQNNKDHKSVSLPSLEYLREKSGFLNCFPDDVYDTILKQANGRRISRSGFHRCFSLLLAAQRKKITKEISHIIDSLFNLFANSGDTADSIELACGVSILCGGTREDKVSAAFSFYDFNNDGYISQNEMYSYLFSVFKVLYATSSVTRSSMQVSPEDLARVTASQAFLEADTNKDGKLSFEEFKHWYSQPSSLRDVNSLNGGSLSISEIRFLTNLESLSVEEVFELFASAVNDQGVLDRKAFNICFNKLIALANSNGQIHQLNDIEKDKVVNVVNRLFKIFDSDGNGVVDFVELASGLTVLCGGSREEKVVAAFSLYDVDGDGFISLEEMETYLTSVFRVMFETSPDSFSGIDITPGDLGRITAKQAFMEADLDHDGRVSFQEFQHWYSSVDSATVKEDDRAINCYSRANLTIPLLSCLENVKELSNLHSYDVRDIFQFFTASADSKDQISRQRFFRCFNKLIHKARDKKRSSGDREKIKSLLERLFCAFDVDGNGLIDSNELSIGLSILCGGKNKVECAFSCYDANKDGYISKEEMLNYLTSVFKVIFEISPESKRNMGVSCEELAMATTNQCFEDCDKNRDGRLSLEEFTLWYSNSHSTSDTMVSMDTLEDVKRFSGLQNIPVPKAFQVFAQASNDDGVLTLQNFHKCFAELMRESNNPKMTIASKKMIENLFRIFDTDNNGLVDFSEFASGLSVLCGGTRDEKVKAAFCLYDANGDGYISFDEMVVYLTSVFKVVYETDQATKKRMKDISPYQLAMATVQQAFLEADADRDNRLSFEEFQKWYSQSKQENFNKMVAPVSMDEIRLLTNLRAYTVNQVFEIFRPFVNQENCVTRSGFNAGLKIIVLNNRHMKVSKADEQRIKVVVDSLFNIFDVDQDDLVDFNKLMSGLSILCGGSSDENIKAAFKLYDSNGDGFISVDEMTQYLTAIFKLVYETQPELAEKIDVSYDMLAAYTSQQAFADADTNKDGKLSYEEFKQWYLHTNGGENQLRPCELNLSINDIRRLSKLDQFPTEDIFELFAEVTDEDGVLNRRNFNSCFRRILGKENPGADSETIKMIVDRLFDVFDVDKDGNIDFSELASGLSVLCGGSREDKVKAAFRLYDYNGDGYISLDEMIKYLTSVFKVLFELSQSHRNEMGDVQPDELAVITAEQAFIEADLNHDGRLSLSEFQKWYMKSNSEKLKSIVVDQQVGDEEYQEEISRNKEKMNDEEEDEDNKERNVANDLFNEVNLQQIRRLTNLQSYKATDIFQMFLNVADKNGTITRAAFNECFLELIDSSKNTPIENENCRIILDRLFSVFENDGKADLTELVSGLSIMCADSRDDKVKAAFSLYDLDNDGYISSDEMTKYLVSVFKVLYETSPQTRQKMGGSTAEELGRITAKQAFIEADTNQDGRISLEEFRNWYVQSNEPNHKVPVSLSEMRHITCLSLYSPEEIFERFAEKSNEEGTLSREAFIECFYSLFNQQNHQTNSENELILLKEIVNRLFDIFDHDDNGVVDFSELASGLSVLCGGSREDKVMAAFNLYDYNGDGFISLDEMTRYLTSVFRVLYETNPETAEGIGVSAEELGRITAEQEFLNLDSNRDGKLSYEEFSQWYLQPTTFESDMNEESKDSEHDFGLNLNELRSLTNLNNYLPMEVFEVFRNCVDKKDILSKEAFYACFQEFNSTKELSTQEEIRLGILLDRLFTIFDMNGDGVVDSYELLCGLSVLCNGSRDDKVTAAFRLYDRDGDGYISLDEMIKYLGSVFRVLYETNPESLEKLGVYPDELATITAEQCFQEANLNKNGRLNFFEFKKWYTRTAGALDMSSSETSAEGNQNGNVDAIPTSMDKVRRLTKLDSFQVNEIFEIFAEEAPTGELTRSSFEKCFNRIIELAGGYKDEAELLEGKEVILSLFSIFDSDKNGRVDFGELASGLSVLSGSSMDDKVKAAFQLYDINGDGYISLEEMQIYMTSIFKVMYETSLETKQSMSVGPEELAKATASHCFEEADLNHDGRLSFDEFKRWCMATA